MTKIILRGPVQRDFAIEVLGKLDLSKVWEVEIKRHQKKRSLNQNSLYWKWLGIISNDTGEDADDLHKYFKSKFLQPVLVDVAGDTEKIYRSTTKLSTLDMSEYMDKINSFAVSQLGIILPQPDDR